jgi:hypothetical protein
MREQDEFEYTKGATRIRKSKKDRLHWPKEKEQKNEQRSTLEN